MVQKIIGQKLYKNADEKLRNSSSSSLGNSLNSDEQREFDQIINKKPTQKHVSQNPPQEDPKPEREVHRRPQKQHQEEDFQDIPQTTAKQGPDKKLFKRPLPNRDSSDAQLSKQNPKRESRDILDHEQYRAKKLPNSTKLSME